MTQTKCKHLDDDNICHGLYDGFGCIGDKCRDPSAGPAEDVCNHMRGDGYCFKLGKFHCGGRDCEHFES